MKKTVLILSVLFASCKSSIKEFHQSKSDTAITVALYLNNELDAKVTEVYRIIKDTFSFDTMNTETAKRVWRKDTLYFVPVLIPRKDSSGHVIKDSIGNVKADLQFDLLKNKGYMLQDYNRHL